MNVNTLPLIAMALAMTDLASCTAKVRSPEAEVKLPGVKIEVEDEDKGKHCPPGHAKKGWC